MLTLAAATYAPSSFTPSVTLVFSRPINIAGLSIGAIHLDDGEFAGQLFIGTGVATLDNPTTVTIPLASDESSESTEVLLTAWTGNGIVAADNAEPWNGVNELVLPFP